MPSPWFGDLFYAPFPSLFSFSLLSIWLLSFLYTMSSVRILTRGVDLAAARVALHAPRASIGSTLLRRELSSAAIVRPTALRPLRSNAPVAAATSQSASQAVRYASNSTEPLSKTQLFDLHVERGAKMVPFAGFDMPLVYSDMSHVESHLWTREKASLFDVSHM